jgi:plasmid stabilization system protein ParE
MMPGSNRSDNVSRNQSALYVIPLLIASACAKTPSEAERVDKAFETVATELSSSPQCGTEDLTPEQGAEIEAILASSRFAPRAPGSVEIPVRFHVISASNGDGNISRTTIDNQIRVLNDSFSGATGGADTAFRFRLVGVNRTVNDTWFRGCEERSVETAMKAELHRGDGKTLNIYTCSGATLLGYAYYPSFPGLPGSDLDGVVLHYGSLPGGFFANYNLGDTAPHEVGHWLGLEHTFKNGCSAPGDSVGDTSPEASPAYHCPIGRDSCGGGGSDPVRNFMDYSNDPCKNRFSNGQASRMDRMHQLYR